MQIIKALSLLSLATVAFGLAYPQDDASNDASKKNGCSFNGKDKCDKNSKGTCICNKNGNVELTMPDDRNNWGTVLPHDAINKLKKCLGTAENCEFKMDSEFVDPDIHERFLGSVTITLDEDSFFQREHQDELVEMIRIATVARTDVSDRKWEDPTCTNCLDPNCCKPPVKGSYHQHRAPTEIVVETYHPVQKMIVRVDISNPEIKSGDCKNVFSTAGTIAGDFTGVGAIAEVASFFCSA